MRSADQARVLGPRALATRRRILDATAAQLETGGLRDFKVVDVARSVGTSPATFYQYFPTVEEAILALSEEVNQETGRLREIVESPWRGVGGLDLAREFVAEYVEHFDRHRAVLRIRNLAAQEGDARFRKTRNESLLPLTQALAAKIEQHQQEGTVSTRLNAFAAGGAMMALMERMAAFAREFELRGVDRDALIETTALIVWQTVAGEHAA